MKKDLGHLFFEGKKDLGHVMSCASYLGIQNLLSWKLGVEEPFNVMAAASVTFGVHYGFMKPGSIRSRVRNMALVSVRAGALGFPIGMIQKNLMEIIRGMDSAANPHSAVKEDVEENVN